jgi:PKD repeat protein
LRDNLPLINDIIMKEVLSFLCLMLLTTNIFSQSCAILAKANNMTPDKLCSPVNASWNVTYTGVDDGGASVEIMYDWDDGTAPQYIPAINTGAGVFQATISHTYTSAGNVCNYHPQATLVVNGVVCTSSSQEQIVTVWDDDNHNGGHMHINPTVYPICVGNSDNVRFQDLTQFNCVPPQENDVPNLYTRWIQWIYGTDITMTGTPVTINGASEVFPYTTPVIVLPGPVTGSGVYSDIINVANDKLVGQYFQVTLRNWNYCNPYDDPNIAGPPADPVNGDHTPVTTTAIILIVPYPDATITPVSDLCLNDSPVTLIAHDAGGTWSGAGVTGNIFNPASAGVGTHTISYTITTASGCSDNDQTTITVNPVPDATITPVGSLCLNDPSFTLTAHDPGGTWAGVGVTGSTFDPAAAGTGSHVITYSITNPFGCYDSDQITITVNPSPDATITPVGNFCLNDSSVPLSAHDAGGIWSGPGVTGNTFDPGSAGAGTHTITYSITIGGCSDTDQIMIIVYPSPVATITPTGSVCLNDPVLTLTAHDPGGTWSGAGVTGNIFNPASAGVGNHIITYSITNINGCTDSDQTTITVNSSPDATITPVPDLCLDNAKVNLTAHDVGGTWSGPGLTGNTFDPVAAGVGSHTITYNISNGSCFDTDQITINVFPMPDATISPPGSVCINNPAFILTAHDSGGTWSGNGVTGSTFNPAAAGVGNHLITYSIINLNGCSDSDQVTITVSPVPDATITPVDTLCISNPSVALVAKNTGGVWSGATSNNIFDPAIEGVGNHIVIYTINDLNGCSDIDQITITVVPVPAANIDPVGNFLINSPSVTLTATPPGGIFTGDGITGNVFNPGTAGPGTHIIQYQTIADRFGCMGTDTIHIRVSMPPLPVALFLPDTTGCSPVTVHFVNKSINADSYVWDFGDNVYSIEKAPSHTYYVPGEYIVTLTSANLSGQSTYKSYVIVNQNPTASFSIYPTEVTNAAQIVVCSNYSYFDDSRLWNFGDGTTSTEENPWHKYVAEGTYNVSLIVTSIEGCIDTATFATPVHVKFELGKLEFPNAFVWNRTGATGGYWQDGSVDDGVFRPHFENVLEYNLKIFNRWGVLIYESNELHKGWDGYFGNGNLALEGVYVWRAIGRYADGEYFDEIGDVTFLH